MYAVRRVSRRHRQQTGRDACCCCAAYAASQPASCDALRHTLISQTGLCAALRNTLINTETGVQPTDGETDDGAVMLCRWWTSQTSANSVDT